MINFKLILRYIITGVLFIVIPLVVLVLLFGKAIAFIRPLGHTLTVKFQLASVFGPGAVLFVSTLIVLLLSLVFGYFIVNGFLKTRSNKLEAVLFYNFPAFQMMKYRFIDEDDYRKQNFWEPILLKDDTTYNIAFITDRSQPNFLSIYVPDAPKMDAGEVRYMLTADCEYISITMKQAINGLRNFGAGMNPEVFANS